MWLVRGLCVWGRHVRPLGRSSSLVAGIDIGSAMTRADAGRPRAPTETTRTKPIGRPSYYPWATTALSSSGEAASFVGVACARRRRPAMQGPPDERVVATSCARNFRGATPSRRGRIRWACWRLWTVPKIAGADRMGSGKDRNAKARTKGAGPGNFWEEKRRRGGRATRGHAFTRNPFAGARRLLARLNVQASVCNACACLCAFFGVRID